jgi:hypothetical protein
MDDIKPINRQRAMQEAAGMQVLNSPNPDYRALNIAGMAAEQEQKNSFKAVKNTAVVFDLLTGGIALIPAFGWVLNACIFFPAGFLTIYLMSSARGKSLGDFFSAYKFGAVEAIPYLNIVTPIFITGAYRLAGESLFDNIMSKF